MAKHETSETEATVVYVDDDPSNRLIMEDLINARGYRCVLFESGQQCLNNVLEHEPHIILMDVMMPGMSGLETCINLRHIESLQNVPVIFLSSNNELEDRLQGYTAGGDDYIGKPFENEEVLAKIDSAIKRKAALMEIHQKAQQSELTTKGLMTTLGEVGLVMHFLQGMAHCKSYHSLAQKIIQAHSGMELDISIEIRVSAEKQHFVTGDVEHPLEESVFDYVQDKGRLVDFNERTVVNYPAISILIRNMPLHDMEKYGRIKDYIAIIAEGANTKIEGIKSDLLLVEQYKTLLEIMDETGVAIRQIDSDYKQQQENSSAIISGIAQQLESSFLHLGLSEEQEAFLSGLINDAEQEIKTLFQQGLSLDDKFNHVLGRMEQALASLAIPEAEPEPEEMADDDIFF